MQHTQQPAAVAAHAGMESHCTSGKRSKDEFALSSKHNKSVLRRQARNLQVATLMNRHSRVFCGLSVPTYMAMLMCTIARELFSHDCMPHCHVELVDASQTDEPALLTHPRELVE